MMFARNPVPHEVFSELPDATRWLASRLDGHVTARALLDAAVELRATVTR